MIMKIILTRHGETEENKKGIMQGHIPGTLSEEGIMKTNGAKVEPVLVSRDVPDWFKNINKTDYQYAYAATNQYNKQYRLLIPNIGTSAAISDKDREIRYDYESGVWSEHKYAGEANVIAAIENSWDGTWNDESRTWDDINITWDDAYWQSGRSSLPNPPSLAAQRAAVGQRVGIAVANRRVATAVRNRPHSGAACSRKRRAPRSWWSSLWRWPS